VKSLLRAKYVTNRLLQVTLWRITIDAHRRETIRMHTMRHVIQSKLSFNKTSTDPHWWRLFTYVIYASNCLLKVAHLESHGRETMTLRLARHRRTHTDEKPFTCDLFHKSFAECSNLTIHKRKHTLVLWWAGFKHDKPDHHIILAQNVSRCRFLILNC